jgi:hypothetical protein
MEKERQGNMIQVVSGTFNEAAMIQSILENEGIFAELKDEYLGTIAPHLASPGGAGSVKVLVYEEDFQRALQIVEEVEKSRRI